MTDGETEARGERVSPNCFGSADRPQITNLLGIRNQGKGWDAEKWGVVTSSHIYDWSKNGVTSQCPWEQGAAHKLTTATKPTVKVQARGDLMS